MTTEQRQQAAALTRRRYDTLTHPYQGGVESLVAELQPAHPLFVLRPDKVAANARRFLTRFPGETLYAVKCNPEKVILQTMVKTGLSNFDCASIEEIRTIRKLAPKAKIFFMHPIKGREAIREAYHVHGVRAFVLDCVDELYKILQETELAPDLELFVRLAIPKAGAAAALDLTGKFGATQAEAVALLQQCRPVSARLGMSFHVGSQCMKPERYAKAIHLAAAVVKASGVQIEVLDVGGGFPAEYPNYAPAPFESYMDAIRTAVSKHRRFTGIQLLCEPGRAMVADSGTIVVRVEQRKGDLLYLNDGTYGSLFDAGGQIRSIFTTKLHRPDAITPSANEAPFRFAGPTCDSIDMMQGPFILPEDAAEGDWIEIQGTGAYCANMQTRFNGFGQTSLVVLKDTENQENIVRL